MDYCFKVGNKFDLSDGFIVHISLSVISKAYQTIINLEYNDARGYKKGLIIRLETPSLCIFIFEILCTNNTVAQNHRYVNHLQELR